MGEKSATPAVRYICSTCGGYDCKLWRKAYSADELRCWVCLEAKGHRVACGSDTVYDANIDSGTSWLPAVPDLDGSWWGYTSVPQWWCAWWRALPNRRDTCKLCCGTGLLSEDVTCFECGGGREVIARMTYDSDSKSLRDTHAT